MTAIKSILLAGLAMSIGLSTVGCKRPWSRRGADPTRPDPFAADRILDADNGEAYLLGDRDGFEGARHVASEFDNVLFAFDSTFIADAERPKIEAVARSMTANPRLSVVLEGHCDERGSREYNLALGERRALAVRAYLIRLGIDGSRIQTLSYGAERPLDPGHNETAWRLNRRVEFRLLQR